jgi:hypothetical protein
MKPPMVTVEENREVLCFKPVDYQDVAPAISQA